MSKSTQDEKTRAHQKVKASKVRIDTENKTTEEDETHEKKAKMFSSCKKTQAFENKSGNFLPANFQILLEEHCSLCPIL